MNMLFKYLAFGMIIFCVLWFVKQFSFPIPYSNDHLILFGFDPEIVRRCCSQGTIHLQNLTMIEFVFYIVVILLYGTGYVFGFGYREVNIILYFLIVPYSWLWMLDRCFEFHYLKISASVFYTISLIWILSTYAFADFSDMLFTQSVVFLHSFAPVLDYWEASVCICLLLPIGVYTFLWELLKRKKARITPK